MGIFNKPKKEKIEKATKEMRQMEQDKLILRYFIVDVEQLAIRDFGICRCIYPKLGLMDDIVKIPYIDFVREFYDRNGISLKKLIFSSGSKETEVLCITEQDISKLSDMQQKFLNDTAPLRYTFVDRTAGSRVAEILNSVYTSTKESGSKEKIRKVDKSDTGYIIGTLPTHHNHS